MIDKTFKPETIKPTFKIGSVSISGNILEINIIGGCEKHSYKLISNGYYEKSLPPQIILHLADQQNKKPCDKKINKILFCIMMHLQ